MLIVNAFGLLSPINLKSNKRIVVGVVLEEKLSLHCFYESPGEVN